MGYHVNKIPRGQLREFSKIKEEYTELVDALEQNNNVLMICEFCDLIGAIESYVQIRFNLNLSDLIKMKDCTKSAFENGERTHKIG